MAVVVNSNMLPQGARPAATPRAPRRPGSAGSRSPSARRRSGRAARPAAGCPSPGRPPVRQAPAACGSSPPKTASPRAPTLTSSGAPPASGGARCARPPTRRRGRTSPARRPRRSVTSATLDSAQGSSHCFLGGAAECFVVRRSGGCVRQGGASSSTSSVRPPRASARSRPPTSSSRSSVRTARAPAPRPGAAGRTARGRARAPRSRWRRARCATPGESPTCSFTQRSQPSIVMVPWPSGSSTSRPPAAPSGTVAPSASRSSVSPVGVEGVDVLGPAGLHLRRAVPAVEEQRRVERVGEARGGRAAAVGDRGRQEERPRSASRSGRASGALIAPAEVNWPSCGRNGTGPENATLPSPSLTVTRGA